MQRRTFLQSLAAASMTSPLVHTQLGATTRQTDFSGDKRHLVLIELAGGNDGLNTVIPYRDPRYRELRPNIALSVEQTLQLSESTGLHPSLKPLLPMWERGDLAIIEGMGYPEPNRSHFRSIEIWETASKSDETLQEGWLKPITDHLHTPGSSVKAVALAEDQGPLAGSTGDTIVFDNLKQFIKQSRALTEQAALTRNPSLKHILDVQKRTQNTALQFAESIQSKKIKQNGFPKNPLASQLKTVADIISSRTGPRVFKVGLGSFDTHQGQLRRHASLLQQLGSALQAFQNAMQNAGQWNNVMIMTYSEFGRRAAQNGSGGTDHGTAAPQFVLGGSINGGLHGKAPSLDHLENDDLVHTIDFRSLYRTVAEDWLNVDARDGRYQDFDKLDLIG